MYSINTNHLHIEANNPHRPANLMVEGEKPIAQNSDWEAHLRGVKAELADWKGNGAIMVNSTE